MEIKTIAVLGAGAVGSYLIWGYYEKYGGNLWVVAEGERAERLKRDGLTINGQKYDLHVRTPEEARGADLLYVNVKYGALPAALDDIATVADEHTIVMSLMNGVESEDVIGERIGREKVLDSVIKIASERKGDSVRFNAETTMGIIIGETGEDKYSERVKAVEETYKGTGLHYRISEDITKDIWIKFIVNVSRNLPQAILSVGTGAYDDSEYVGLMSKRLLDEVIAVGAAKGIDLSDQAQGPKINPNAKRARYSTLQDLDAGRKTEVDMFAGAMVRMGKALGVPVPYSEYTYLLIKALEEKNEGKFDYE